MNEARGAQAKVKPAASRGDTLQADNLANSVGSDLTTLSRSAAQRIEATQKMNLPMNVKALKLPGLRARAITVPRDSALLVKSVRSQGCES